MTAQAQAVRKALANHIADRGKLAVVKAPPGSGKTWLLLKTAEVAYKQGWRVAVATQTNAQADDICRRLAKEYPAAEAIRFAGQGHTVQQFGSSVIWETDSRQLPPEACIVVGTSAKWGLIEVQRPFDILFVEEAWQLSWADFMLLGQVSKRFVLIGDPGQIPPVVTVDVARWETAPRAPHRPAPEEILRDPSLKKTLVLELGATRRLPFDSVPLVMPFYDFKFGAFAQAGDRILETRPQGRRVVDRVVETLRKSSVAALTIPTPPGGPPLDVDQELAVEAVSFMNRLLSSEANLIIDGQRIPLEPRHIGLVSTHRVMNAAIERSLSARLRSEVKVDTPERWQGLELPVMIVVHPLSGVVRPTSFDLETGRLCVMASRHQVSLVVVTRDHIGSTLRDHIPSAEQPLGRDDITGRGHSSNLHFWTQLEERELITSRGK